MRYFWIVGIALGLFLLWRVWRSTSLPPLDDSELQSLYARGRIDEVERRLERHLARRPQDPEPWLRLAKVLVVSGRSNAAIEALRTGHTHVRDDRLLAFEAYLHRDHARLGPGRQINSTRWNLAASREIEDEEAWRRNELELASSLLTQALELNPAHSAHRLGLAEVLDQLELPERSAPLWGELSSDPDLQPFALVGYARALIANGEQQRPNEVLARARPQAEHTAEYWEALAALEEAAEGSVETVQSHRDRAAFYACAPDFVQLRFSENLHSILQDIRATVPSHKEGVTERDLARRTPALERLLNESSDETTELLAAICYSHEQHGKFEVQAVESLADRGERGRELVLLLLEEAPSNCTRRAAAAALADRGELRALPVLLQLLPQDNNWRWPVGVALALAKLGDHRAIEPLISLLAPTWRSSDESAKRETSFDEKPTNILRSPRLARSNAAIALGYFDDDAARNALRKGLKNPEVELSCRVALYRLERDETLLANIDAELKPEIREELARIDDAVTRPLVEESLRRLREAQSDSASED